MPLPVERPRPAGGHSKEHRFRPQDAALAARIQPFRALHDLTQGEVALTVGAAGGPTVSQWEQGVNVPDGMRKRELVALLDGHRWNLLRESAIGKDGYPQRWEQAVRWYRRASREVRARQVITDPLLLFLKELRVMSTTRELRDHYLAQGRGWTPDPSWTLPAGATGRLVEDCAYGLRWIEIVRSLTVDVRLSLVPQLPDALLSTLAPSPPRRRTARPKPPSSGPRVQHPSLKEANHLFGAVKSLTP